MRPKEVADTLRQIATAIENSKKPQRDRVASAIKGLISRIAAEDFKCNCEISPKPKNEHLLKDLFVGNGYEVDDIFKKSDTNYEITFTGKFAEELNRKLEERDSITLRVGDSKVKFSKA